MISTIHKYDCAHSNLPLTFTQVNDELVISFRADYQQLVEYQDIVSQLFWNRHEIAPQVFSAGNGFAVVKTAEKNTSVTDDTANGIQSQLRKDKLVSRVINVFEDRDGSKRYFLPDEVCVRFIESASDEDITELLNLCDMPICALQRSNQYFTLTIPSYLGLFEALDLLNRLELVDFAEPSEVGINNIHSDLDVVAENPVEEQGEWRKTNNDRATFFRLGASSGFGENSFKRWVRSFCGEVDFDEVIGTPLYFSKSNSPTQPVQDSELVQDNHAEFNETFYEKELRDVDVERRFQQLDQVWDRERGIWQSPIYIGGRLFGSAAPLDTQLGDKTDDQRSMGVAVRGASRCSGFSGDIETLAAWQLESGSRHVIVAVVDGVADLTHPDIQANILPELGEFWDFSNFKGKNGQDKPGYSDHATHILGTIAANGGINVISGINTGAGDSDDEVINESGKGQIGMCGVAPGVLLMPVKVDLLHGKIQDRVDAINYVIDQAIKYKGKRRYVINCSWSINGDHTGMRLALERAWQHNVLIVFAAGNEGADLDDKPSYPAVYPNVLSVMATDANDRLAGFSNYGKKVTVAAPGVNVFSTTAHGSYELKDGTSMAAAHVSGIAALVWSRNPSITNQQVKQCIERACDPVAEKNPGYESKLGCGRVNANRALLVCPKPFIESRYSHGFCIPEAPVNFNVGVCGVGICSVDNFPLGAEQHKSVVMLLRQSQSSDHFYFLAPQDGRVLATTDVPAVRSSGEQLNSVASSGLSFAAWDGAAIRIASIQQETGQNIIRRVNAVSGGGISSIPAPPGICGGLAVVGNHIFYSTINQIHEISGISGKEVRSFPAPQGNCRGLAYGRGFLFCYHDELEEISVINPWRNITKGTIALASFPDLQSNQIHHQLAFSFDEGTRTLYLVNRSENTIHALHIDI